MQLSNPTLWRTHPHTVKGYLYVLDPAVVLACSVNQASFSYPLAQVTYDTVTSGAYTNVQVGQTVKLMSSGGIFKGWARIRLAPTSSILYLGAISQGEINLADNDLIEVLDEFRIWAKMPRIDATDPLNAVFYKDYDLVYSDQNTQPPPKLNAGPYYINFVDAVSGVITVNFNLSSYAIANGATIGANPYSGSIEDGTITSGAIASGTFTATFPAGKRWLSFTVADSNGKTHTMHVLVVACERTGSNAPLRARVSSMRHTVEGTEASFSILADDASTDVIPTGAVVLYFEEEKYGGAPGSLNGYPGRQHVKFVGWTTEAQSQIDPDTGNLEITARGPTGILAALPFFSASLSNAASPSHWFEMSNLTLWRFIWYLLHWHTTALDLFDLERPSWYASYPYSRFDVDAGDIYSQIDNVARSVTARLSCDHQGILYLRQDPQLMNDADRNSLTTIVTLTSADWSGEISIPERHRPQLRWLRGSALLASTSVVTPYLSIAPGKSPAQGQIEDVLERQLVIGQSDLNIRTGHVFANKNSAYPQLNIPILHGGTVAHPAWREWVKLTMAASTNKRGLSYSATRFVLSEVAANYDFDQGATDEQWVIEQETSGVPGVTEPVPTSRMEDIGYVGLPPYLPITLEDYEPVPTAQTSFPDMPALYATFNRRYFCRTRNPADASPNWEIVLNGQDTTLFPGGSVIANACTILDPWNPKQAAYMCIQDTASAIQVYYIENLDGPAGTQIITKIFDTATPFPGVVVNNLHIASSINVEGMVWFAFVPTSPANLYIYRRTSYSGSFAQVNVAAATAQLLNIAPGYHGTGSGVHVIYAGYTTGGVGKVVRSTNGGGLYSLIYTHASAEFGHTIVPYKDNANDNILYAGFQGTGADAVIRRETNGTFTNIAPQYTGNYYGIQSTGISRTLHPYTGDRLRLSMIGINGSDKRLFLSTDGGDTWVETNTPGNEHGTNLGDLYGWPYDFETMVIVVRAGGNRGLWRTANFYSGSPSSVSYTNMLGDIESVIGTTITDIFDVAPVWVK